MGSSSKFSLTKSTRCFSVLVESNKDYGELSSEFIKQFGKELGLRIYLQDPKGTIFKVRVAKSATRGFITSGFSELVAFYGLGHWSWLDLKYLGDSFFSMTIDNADLDEIDYTPTPVKDELLSDCDNDNIETPLPAQNSNESNDSFSTVLTKYKATSSQLNIPSSFARKYMGRRRGKWILRDGEGGVFNCKVISTKRRKTEVKIGSGWKAFCRAKQVKAGDKCVFQIANEEEKILNVTIIPS